MRLERLRDSELSHSRLFQDYQSFFNIFRHRGNVSKLVLHFFYLLLSVCDQCLNSHRKLFYLTCIVWLVVFDLLLQHLALGIDVLLCGKFTQVALTFNVNFKLRQRHINPAAGSRALKYGCLQGLGSHTLDLIWLSQLANLVPEHLACSDTLMRIRC